MDACITCGRDVVWVGAEPRHAAWSGDHLPTVDPWVDGYGPDRVDAPRVGE